ncbi:enoyl-CoA hydratase [Jatrophihabitans endophyticus]|uniref:Enoyl-CoA hydratase n=1 Tax=Jatrophihabitans endophyticus TaxID=1206085 RepID=A0A1M5PRL9_9ACTN|nr:crotonase/enoyl-CoA hydratase family protein [Jatrophihabitans endophyticus]SHH04424.1 enoyl-CoA hydratase [Jatrophihabitans endophyticus]
MPEVQFEPDPDTHVAVIRLDRPEARNAVTGDMAEAIEAALDTVEGDDRLWVTVVTGTDDVFCSGGDLREVAAGDPRMRTRRGGFAGIVRRERRKPLVAAVEGPAVGGGTEIVLASDLVVAGDGATFGLPEVRNSLLAAAGGLFRLGRHIPPTVAMQWALTGDYFPAARAYELGLINEVVPAGDALRAARELAARICRNAPLAVQHSRAVMLEATWLPEDEAWRRNTEAMRELGRTADFHEGMAAAAEKRPPKWTAS